MATLNFKGKSFVQNYHLTVKYHQLVPKPSKSLTRKVSLNDNLIIHGDNLAALGDVGGADRQYCGTEAIGVIMRM